MSSIKSNRHVEISEQVINLGEETHGNEVDDSHVFVSDDEDIGECMEVKVPTPRIVKRNAMGEYIPGEDEKALTQQALSGPGPSTYTPVIELTKPMAPQYSIVGKVKDKKDVSSPGPKYNTSQNMVWNKKTRTLKAKLETSPYRPKYRDHLTCSLGSAAYKVEYYDTGKHAPQYTAGSRFHEPIILGPPNKEVEPVDTKGFTAPGPSYSPFGCRGMEKSFGLKFKATPVKDIPGPAQYNIKSSDRGPQYSLGHKLQDQSTFDGPGPGFYDIKSTIGSGVATSIRGRQKIRMKYSVPSPNTYILPDTFRDAPRHSMTYRPFENEVCETPGPANYNQACGEIWKSPPEFSCRKQCKPSFPAILNYPEHDLMKNVNVGPDTYDADKGFDKNNSPAYSMGNTSRDIIDDHPGPNHYHINLPYRPDANKAPEFSMGQSTKKVIKSCGPGPAAYHPQVKKTAQGYSMSGRPKPLKTVKPTPAPNAYKVCKGQTSKGINNGCSVSLKSRASPYVYTGFPNLARITT